jgi:hypothetical protein
MSNGLGHLRVDGSRRKRDAQRAHDHSAQGVLIVTEVLVTEVLLVASEIAVRVIAEQVIEVVAKGEITSLHRLRDGKRPPTSNITLMSLLLTTDSHETMVLLRIALAKFLPHLVVFLISVSKQIAEVVAEKIIRVAVRGAEDLLDVLLRTLETTTGRLLRSRGRGIDERREEIKGGACHWEISET